ncbi:hypothetical protein QO231_15200 [Sedimentitalea todarodis]|uniref:EamA domain-containing protein n=1 Tax=Sedimentitalea todarodis TaxID=1631240 RepID=A0ABU3VG77_9RHOB|nr:hypothetical protein [Sedimentitalea todarodis]
MAARKGAAFSAGAVFITVGVAFLTVAGWIFLSELRSELFAATILGLVYVGAAAIAFAAGSGKTVEQTQTSAPGRLAAELSPLQIVVLSFVQGFERGRQNSRRI